MFYMNYSTPITIIQSLLGKFIESLRYSFRIYFSVFLFGLNIRGKFFSEPLTYKVIEGNKIFTHIKKNLF